MMYSEHIKRLEVTTDKDKANEFLKAGWSLLRIKETPDGKFVFLFGYFELPTDEK